MSCLNENNTSRYLRNYRRLQTPRYFSFPSAVLNLQSSLAFFSASQRTGLIDCVAVLQQAVSNDSLKTSPSSPAALLACVSLPVSLLPRLLFRLQFSG